MKDVVQGEEQGEMARVTKLIEDTPKKKLKFLLEQIHECEMAVPDFQRDFTWEPSMMQELVVSVAKNYPAGSLLAIRNTANYFASRSFKGAPDVDGKKPTYLILDGQQRLTSLYQALRAAGDYRFFLDIHELMNGADLEETIFYLRKSAKGRLGKEYDKYSDVCGQADDLVLPLDVIFGDKDGFVGWKDAVTDRVSDENQRRVLNSQLRDVKTSIIDNFENYEFPTVLLSDETPADAVCAIFETLNRTGVRLSIFDLLVARFWAQDLRLRELWAKAQLPEPSENSSPLKEFEIDPYYVLQSIALLRKDVAPSCKRANVLSLTAKEVEDNWDPVVDGMKMALSILQDDCGMVMSKWLPYKTILIPFSAMIASNPAKNTMMQGELRGKLTRWYWCSVLGQRYEKASNSQAAKDFVEVGGWMGGGPTPKEIESFSFEPSALLEVTPKQRALYQGLICLILSRNPRDFHKARPMTKAIMVQEEVEDHHIFPRGYLQSIGVVEEKRIDCVLNRTLIDGQTNRSISASTPSDYLNRIESSLGKKALDDILESHVLPIGSDSSLMKNDYDSFIDWRLSEIHRLIKEVTS